MPYASALIGEASQPARRLNISAESFSRIARVVKGRWLESAFSRTSQEDQRTIDYRRADPGFVNRQSVQQDPAVKFAYTWQALRKKRGWLLGQLQQDVSWRTAVGADRLSMDYGPSMSRWLERNLSLPDCHVSRNNDVVIERGLDMGMKYGVNWWLASWDNDPDWWGVRYENVRWEDVYCDWKGNRWYVVRSFEPVWKVIERAKSWIELPVTDPYTDREIANGADLIAANAKYLVEEVERGQASLHRYDQWYSVDANRHQRDAGKVTDDDEYGDTYWVNPKDDPLNMRVPVLTFIELRKHGYTCTVIPSYGGPGGDLLFASCRAPYRYCQLVPFVPYPVDEEVFGHSLPYIVGHLDETMSWALRAQLRFFARWADPAILFRSGTKLGRRDLEVLSNRRIEVEDTEDVKPMDAPVANAGMHQMALQLTRGIADENIAESPERRGIASQGTATAVARASQNSQVDDGLVAWAAKQSLRQLMRVSIELLRVHMTEEKAIAVAGLDGGTDIIQLSPKFVKGSYDIIIKGDLVSPDQQQSVVQLMDGFTRMGPMFLNPEKTWIEYARLCGRPEWEGLLNNRLAPKPKRPEDEHIDMLVYGRSVAPSPRENPMEHLLKHQQLQMEAMRKLPPEHPVHALLGEHIMLTQQMVGMMTASAGGETGTPPGEGASEEAPVGGEGNVQTSAGASEVQRMRSGGGSKGAMTPYAPRRNAAVTA